MGAIERWSYETLGQWHYVLGYLIVLVGHNWPLLLSAALCLWGGARLYRRPSRARVCWFFGALLLGLAYEYDKHVGPTLHASLDTVVGAELLWLNGAAHLLVGPAMQLALFGAMAFFLVQGLWLEVGAARVAPSPAGAAQGERQ